MKISKKVIIGLILSLALLRFIDLKLSAPTYSNVYRTLAHDKLKKGQIKEAIDLYHKAATFDPTSNKAYYQLALIYQQIHDDANMIKYFEKVIAMGSELDRMKNHPYERRDYEYANACYQVGLDYKRRGQYAQAIRLMQISFNHYDSLGFDTYEAGLMYNALNDKMGSLAMLKRLNDNFSHKDLFTDLKATLLKSHPEWIKDLNNLS